MKCNMKVVLISCRGIPSSMHAHTYTSTVSSVSTFAHTCFRQVLPVMLALLIPAQHAMPQALREGVTTDTHAVMYVHCPRVSVQSVWVCTVL